MGSAGSGVELPHLGCYQPAETLEIGQLKRISIAGSMYFFFFLFFFQQRLSDRNWHRELSRHLKDFFFPSGCCTLVKILIDDLL